jgi:peptide/nickel transport system ATP-binding protein
MYKNTSSKHNKDYPYMNKTVLDVSNLKTYFNLDEGLLKGVDGVSFCLKEGETLGLVGESGSGKSVSALSIMRLLDKPLVDISADSICLNGTELQELSDNEMNRIRGNQISMIFQEPMTSLNPIYSVGFQISEVLKIHENISAKAALEKAIDLLDKVQIPSPRRRAGEYPHQLSGGMRQRVMIAIALACNPQVLIADEPTTALDVTVQAQILDLMLKLQEDLGTSVLLITHDLGVIAETAQQVAVMYAGQIVEDTDVVTLFQNPMHPYTKGLLQAIPRLVKEGSHQRLFEIPGVVPNLCFRPQGCAFFDRCSEAKGRCQFDAPELISVGDNHKVRCWKEPTNG